VDNLFGLIAIIGVLASLSYAAIQDYKTREVSNWVWVGGVVILPLTLLRISPTGLLHIYGFQLIIGFVIVILGFRVGILGGADGKAILIIGLTYPWIILEGSWLLLAPVGVLIGGFLIVGVNSLVLFLINATNWRRWVIPHEKMKPTNPTYWFTRRLTRPQQEELDIVWVPVSIPFIVYILMAYAVMLVWMGVSVLV
jgi:Flp pilus assembly protein protease CpaA